MRFFNKLFGSFTRQPATAARRPTARLQVENLEARTLMSAEPLPVLMVIANRDVYSSPTIKMLTADYCGTGQSTGQSGPSGSPAAGDGDGTVTVWINDKPYIIVGMA